MLKKLSLILVLLLLVGSLTACGGTNTQTLAPDKEVVPIPEGFILDDVEAETQDSRAFFETDKSLEDLEKYYTDLFDSLDLEVLGNKDQKAMEEEGIPVLPVEVEEGDSYPSSIQWGITGIDKAGTPYSVVVAKEGDTLGVSVGAGYRGNVIARGLNVNIDQILLDRKNEAKAKEKEASK